MPDMPIRPSPARDTTGPPRPSVVVCMGPILDGYSQELVTAQALVEEGANEEPAVSQGRASRIGVEAPSQ